MFWVIIRSVANYLQEQGYVNCALGKRDHTSLYEVSQVDPFDRWPSGEGFDHAYTFMAADVHQFVPVMWNDHTPEPYRKSVHLDQNLADRTIEWITGHKSIMPDLPFMMLWASGSMHSPHRWNGWTTRSAALWLHWSVSANWITR